MFVSVLLPFVDRGSGPLFHWVMLAQMARFDVDDIVFIGDAAYFDESAIPFGDWIKLGGLRFQCPDVDKFRAFRRIELPSELLESLVARVGTNHLALFRYLLTEADPVWTQALEVQLREIAREQAIEAVLSWCNFPALSTACDRLGGIPVIHNELGPLRAPLYRDTVYFDFHGVNGGTSPPTWSRAWVLGELADGQLLEPEQLRGLLVADCARVQALEGPAPVFRAGLALQVEDDSNIVAYASGWSQLDLLYDAMSRFGSDQVSVRAHPGARFVYRGGLGQADASADSLAFLASVEELLSINSSLLAEAALWGRRFEAKGDTPVRFLSDLTPGSDPGWTRSALNAFFLAYLVPAELLFDPEYYRWRLTNPSLSQCISRHLAVWGAGGALTIGALPQGTGLQVSAQAGLVRMPALWTGTLSLERSLDSLRIQLDMNRQQAALQASELKAQLAHERQQGQRWEAEAKQNWQDKELLSKRVAQVQGELASTHAALSAASETQHELARVKAALQKTHGESAELEARLQRAREEQGEQRQELERLREDLLNQRVEWEQEQASAAELAQALTSLVEWALASPAQIESPPDVATAHLGQPGPAARSTAVEAASAQIDVAHVARPGAALEEVLLERIDVLSGRVLGRAQRIGPDEGHSAFSEGRIDGADRPPGEPLAQLQWLRGQLEAVQKQLVHHRWRHYQALQIQAELREEVCAAAGFLSQALVVGGAEPEGVANARIGELAAAVSRELTRLRTRPRTLFERIAQRSGG